MALYTILEFHVSQGEIDFYFEKECFLTYEEAKIYKEKNYPSKGFFWTGLTEYKIVKLHNKTIEECYRCNSAHLSFLRKRYHFA